MMRIGLGDTALLKSAGDISPIGEKPMPREKDAAIPHAAILLEAAV
jgi:hypothetical protein